MMTKLQVSRTNNCKKYQEIKQRKILFDEKQTNAQLHKNKSNNIQSICKNVICHIFSFSPFLSLEKGVKKSSLLQGGAYKRF